MPEKQSSPGQDKGEKETPQPPPQQQASPTATPWPLARPDQIFPPEPPPHHEEHPRATIEFLPGWRQQQRGEIRAGGKLVVEFDPSRLPQCRQSSHGAQVWDIDVGMIFHPGGQRFDGSVMRKVRMPDEGIIVSLEPQPFEVTIPSDATHVEMWFHNYNTLGHGCEAWDSRYCQNYWYGVGK